MLDKKFIGSFAFDRLAVYSSWAINWIYRDYITVYTGFKLVVLDPQRPHGALRRI